MSLAGNEPTTGERRNEPLTPRRHSFVLSIVLVVVSVVGISLWFFLHDGPPPDDADLLPTPRPTVPAEENSFVAWQRAVDQLDNPDSTVERVDDLGEEQGSRQTWLERNRSGLEALRDALSNESFVPRKESGDQQRMYTCFAALDLAARITMEEGGSRAAWEWTEVSKEWLRRFWHYPSRAVPELLAERPAQNSETRLRLAQMLSADPPLLREWLATTEVSELHADWHEQYLKRQYVNLGARIAERPMADQYRPRRTQRTLAHWTRAVLADLETGVDPWRVQSPKSDAGGDLSRWLQVAGGNARGLQTLRQQFLLPREALGEHYFLDLAFHESATRTVLALRIYCAQHGKYPPTLEALVPTVLDALPADPHDPRGKPLRYDRDRKVIWSVGEDENDGGGVSSFEGPVDLHSRRNPDRIVRLPAPPVAEVK